MDGAYTALRGYSYQFDKTMAEIFDKPNTTVAIEQLQDLGFDDYVIQVKHHDTVYPDSQIKSLKKKPTLQLLKLFAEDESKMYVLFMYIKGKTPQELIVTSTDLDDILGSNAKDFSKAIKERFLKKFKLFYGPNFVEQNRKVIKKIQLTFGKTEPEAVLYYALISSHILSKVLQYSPTDKDKRRTSLSEIKELIHAGKKVIFHSAFAELLGVQRYHRFLRNQWFNTGLNLSSFERFFIIQITGTPPISELKEIVYTISKKWSNIKKRNPKPFAPFICFRNLDRSALKELKIQMSADKHSIKDGFGYFDADFNVSQILESPSYENKIAFRIINNEDQLNQLLKVIQSTKEIYQFFFDNQLDLPHDSKHIKVQIESLSDIKTIV